MEQPLTCRGCGTEVLVEKHSWHHTNIQWQAPSATVCPELRAQVERGEPPSRALGCERLRASVRDAALAGELEVADR
jgi:hypothetical protein